VVLSPSIYFKYPLSPSQLSLPPSLLRDNVSHVLGKAVPLIDTPLLTPPLYNIEPEGTCPLIQRGKMQVVTENQEFSLFQGLRTLRLYMQSVIMNLFLHA